MTSRIPRLTRVALLALSISVLPNLPISPVHAQPMLTVADGFDNAAIWGSVNTPETNPGAFVPSGGNPGRYAQLITTTSINNRTGTGYLYLGPGADIRLNSLDTQITLGADLRRVGTLSNSPVPQFVPIITQGARIYQPVAFIPAPTLNQWATVAPMTFRVADFANSSGIPLDLTSTARIGFFLRVPAAPSVPPNTQYGVGVDNVILTVVPTPGTAAIVLAPTLTPAFTRRRRT